MKNLAKNELLAVTGGYNVTLVVRLTSYLDRTTTGNPRTIIVTSLGSDAQVEKQDALSDIESIKLISEQSAKNNPADFSKPVFEQYINGNRVL